MARENRRHRGAKLTLASLTVLISLVVLGAAPAGAYYYDTDGDGLPDFYEIKHGIHGTIADEKADWDGDGLLDIEEDVDGDGIVDVGETDPYNWDTDGDGISDGIEGIDPLTDDPDGDGLVNALDLDSDNDFLPDSVEEQVQLGDTYRDGVWQGVGSNETNWLNPDTDGDGIIDGIEVALVRQHPHGGAMDPVEVAQTADYDGDGLSDGDEFYVWGTDWYDEDSDDDDATDSEELDLDYPPVSPGDPGYDDYADRNDIDRDGMNNAIDYDSDNDGLIDEDETSPAGGRAPTDPYDWDTDDDGYTDGYEVNTAGTPPNIATDTDGDGWADGWEVAWFKTDPNDTDTDGDGMSDDVENPIAGFDPDDPHTGRDTDGDGLIDALDLDSDNDGIDDGEESVLGVDGYVTDPYNDDTDGDGLRDNFEISISCTDPTTVDDDGDGILAGDEVYTYETDFDSSDTDGDGIIEAESGSASTVDRVNTNTDGTYPLPYRDSLVNALDRDADGDGIWDGDEAAYGTSMADWDSDDDGLADGAEVWVWGTDPTNEDTDGDGLEDGEEVLTYGTDPLDPNTDGDYLTDGEEIDMWMVWAPNLPTPHPNPLDPDTDGDSILDGETISGYYIDAAGDTVDWTWTEGGTDDELIPDGFPNILDPDSDWREQHSPGETPAYDYFDFHDRTEVAYGDYVAAMAREERGPWTRFVEGQPLHPGNPDTDGDGYTDFSEVSRGTDPLDARDFSAVPYTPVDSDGDGLWDIEEFILEGTATGTMYLDQDFDGDGLFDGDELHPTLPNLTAGSPVVEWFDVDGFAQSWPTSPLTMHSETDNGLEVSDGETDYEEVVTNPISSNPHVRDTDGDGLYDNVEVLRGYDPTDFDMDDDELWDGMEDQDGDGVLDSPSGYATSYTAETDPEDADTDDDGILDGAERTFRTYQRNMDSDGDGLDDGLEVGYYYVDALDNNLHPDTDQPTFGNGDQDPTTMTDPRLVDSDFDCIEDGDEDLNADGLYDPLAGETDAQDRDSDNDGLYDYYEYYGAVASVVGCYSGWCDNSGDPTLAYDADTDGDGLPDMHEYEQGCESNGAYALDQDEDGAQDGAEFDGVDYVSDPNRADTDLDGYNDYLGEFSLVDDYPDNVEAAADCDLDGIPNVMDVDSDNDWILDSAEGAETSDDIEGDGYVDILDGDRDNDYLADPLEMGLAIYDPRDMDTDDDGLYDGEEYFHPFWHTIGWSCGGRGDTVALTYTDCGVDNQSRDTDGDGWVSGLAYYHHDGFEAGRDTIIFMDMGTTPPTPGTDDDPLIWDADGTQNSDPRYVDSDFDGMWDPLEDVDWDGEDADVGIGLAESDPLDDDTDDDGLFDSWEIDYFGIPMAVNCDTDGDVLPDGLEVGLQMSMGNDKSDWMPTDTDYNVGSACWPGPLYDTVDAGAHTTDPADDDTDDDGLLDGTEDKDQDGFRDGNDVFNDCTSDWATVGETDPNEWDTDRGGEPDGSDADPLSKCTGDWDIDIDPNLEDADDDTLSIGVAGVGVLPGSNDTSTFEVWHTDGGNNPDAFDGPSSAASLDSVYVRATSLHWAGPLWGATYDVPDTSTAHWIHYSHVTFSQDVINGFAAGTSEEIDVTVDVPWGAMPGWYVGYVEVETKREFLEQELPDDYITLRVYVAPHKDLDICDWDGDPRGVGASAPWDMPAMISPDTTQMHLVGAPVHRDTILGMFRVANPNTYPDGVGPYWPYGTGTADGINDYNMLPAIPSIGRVWDVPWWNDAQGNVNLTYEIEAQYEFDFGPADPTGSIWFQNRDQETSPLKSGFELATTDSFNVMIETTELPAGVYSGLVRIFEDVHGAGGPLTDPDNVWQADEVSDTLRLVFWLTQPDLDIDDDYANMAGNELTIGIDPDNYVGEVIEEVQFWNVEGMLKDNVDPWDSPKGMGEDLLDFWFYDTADDVTGTKVSSRFMKIPMETTPDGEPIGGPMTFQVYSDVDQMHTIDVDLYGDMGDTLMQGEAKKFNVRVPAQPETVWQRLLPAGTYRPLHPDTLNVVPDDPATAWPWEFGDGIVPIGTRGMATGMQYAAHADFEDYEDGVLWNPSRRETLETLMDYFYLVVTIEPYIEVRFPEAFTWSVTGDPGTTQCGDAIVMNWGNTVVDDVEFEASNLVGMDYSQIILADYVDWAPASLTIPWQESDTTNVCVAIPEGTRADTYEGTLTVFADDGEPFDELPLEVVVNCVPGMDVMEGTYGVSGNVMSLDPMAGMSDSKEFELCNIGNCDVSGVDVDVTGLPAGLSAVATIDEDVAWNDCILGEVEVTWTDPSLAADTYEATVTVTADGGLTDTFTLEVQVDQLFAASFGDDAMILTTDPDATICDEVLVSNDGNETLDDIQFEVEANLDGDLYGGVLAASAIDFHDDAFAGILEAGESEYLEICASVPDGKRADTYKGWISLFATGSVQYDSLEFWVEVNCVPALDIMDSALDVVGNKMTLTPEPGGSTTGEFRLTNLGNCDLENVEAADVTGLPSGVSADVTIDGTVGFGDYAVGEVEVTWTDPGVSAGTYPVTVTVSADGDVADNFNLWVVITELPGVAFAGDAPEVDGEAGGMVETEVWVMNTGNVDLVAGRVMLVEDDLVGSTGSMIPMESIEVTPATQAIAEGDSAMFTLNISVPEGLLGQDYVGDFGITLDDDLVDDEEMAVTVSIARGDEIVAYPNPCRDSEGCEGITIAIGETDGTPEVMVYDMFGALVADLTADVSEERDMHMQDVQWDLKNDDGKTVASGMYIVSIDTGSEVLTRKVMVIR